LSDDGSITRWFGPLQAGDREAAQRLWQHFASRLIALARVRLRAAPRRAADEEDAVLSAFDSFCRGAEQGRYPRLHDRGDLWNLLVAITVRKASDQVNRERRQKRGGGAVLSEADLAQRSDDNQAFDEIIGTEPTPQMAAEMAEQCHKLLETLPDVELRSIALWRMEGYTNAEIAGKLDCARSTIQRKLQLIQARWEQQVY
jgi:DNA-directed RNA polymerase specialized sigma24 family protein